VTIRAALAGCCAAAIRPSPLAPRFLSSLDNPPCTPNLCTTASARCESDGYARAIRCSSLLAAARVGERESGALRNVERGQHAVVTGACGAQSGDREWSCVSGADCGRCCGGLGRCARARRRGRRMWGRAITICEALLPPRPATPGRWGSTPIPMTPSADADRALERQGVEGAAESERGLDSQRSSHGGGCDLREECVGGGLLLQLQRAIRRR
jgi:hypothetical protein